MLSRLEQKISKTKKLALLLWSTVTYPNHCPISCRTNNIGVRSIEAEEAAASSLSGHTYL